MIPFSRMIQYGNDAPQRPNIKLFKSVSTGSTTSLMLLYDNGSLFARGNNYSYHLGVGGNNVNLTTWTLSNTNVKLFSTATAGSMIVKNDGTLYGVGRAELFVGSGGTSTLYSVWTDITTKFSTDTGKNPLDIIDIKFTGDSTLVLLSDGTLYGIGGNANGELGTGSTSIVTTWRLIANSVQKIASNDLSFSYITSSGEYYRAGRSDVYQLGISGILTSFTKLTISGVVIDINSVTNQTQLLVQNGSDILYYRSGTNTDGKAGDGVTSPSVQTFTNFTILNNVIHSFKGQHRHGGASGSLLSFSYAVKNGGGLLTSGNNSSYQFGNGNTTAKTVYSADTIGFENISEDRINGVHALTFNSTTNAGIIHIDNDLYYCGSLISYLGIPASQTYTKITDLPL